MNSDQHNISVGAAEELSLRVSLGVLVNVLFRNPRDGRTFKRVPR